VLLLLATAISAWHVLGDSAEDIALSQAEATLRVLAPVRCSRGERAMSVLHPVTALWRHQQNEWPDDIVALQRTARAIAASTTTAASEAQLIHLSFVSGDYAPVAANWAHSLEKTGQFNYVLVCLDSVSCSDVRSLLAPSQQRRVVAISTETPVLLASAIVGSTVEPGKVGLWVVRALIIDALLDAGLDTFHSDSDSVWLQPLPDSIAALIRCSDIVASQGTFPREALDLWHTTICMGVVLFRANIRVRSLVRLAVVRMLTVTKDDQIAVNLILKDAGLVFTDFSGGSSNVNGSDVASPVYGETNRLIYLRVSMMDKAGIHSCKATIFNYFS